MTFKEWWHKVGSRPSIERLNLAQLAYHEGRRDALEATEEPLGGKTYHIWSEGYQATGESAKAYLHGIGRGDTFREACISFFQNNRYFSVKNLTYWGCHLFSSEADARKAFG